MGSKHILLAFWAMRSVSQTPDLVESSNEWQSVAVCRLQQGEVRLKVLSFALCHQLKSGSRLFLIGHILQFVEPILFRCAFVFQRCKLNWNKNFGYKWVCRFDLIHCGLPGTGWVFNQYLLIEPISTFLLWWKHCSGYCGCRLNEEAKAACGGAHCRGIKSLGRCPAVSSAEKLWLPLRCAVSCGCHPKGLSWFQGPGERCLEGKVISEL